MGLYPEGRISGGREGFYAEFYGVLVSYMLNMSGSIYLDQNNQFAVCAFYQTSVKEFLKIIFLQRTFNLNVS